MFEFAAETRNVIAVALFAFTYLGMAAGKAPGLALDRTGIALIGAIAAVAFGVLPVDAVAPAIDFQTLAILFALMVLSAQFGLAGFTIGARAASPPPRAAPRGFSRSPSSSRACFRRSWSTTSSYSR